MRTLFDYCLPYYICGDFNVALFGLIDVSGYCIHFSDLWLYSVNVTYDKWCSLCSQCYARYYRSLLPTHWHLQIWCNTILYWSL